MTNSDADNQYDDESLSLSSSLLPPTLPDNNKEAEEDDDDGKDEEEERTRTVLDFTSGVDLKEALSEAFGGKKKDVFLPNPADPAKKMNAVQVGCFGDDARCSPTAVSNIHDVRVSYRRRCCRFS